ncbi:MAG: alkaline phosphatase D family protein [bacterium]|nr:alkaline phosphatase D family protein [bacterium]
MTKRAFNYSTLWSNIEREATKRLIGYMSRRDFMKFLGISAAAGALVRYAPGVKAARRPLPGTLRQGATTTERGTLPNGVASGDTTQTSTVLWVRSTEPGEVLFEVATDEAFTDILSSQSVEATDATIPVKVQINDLTPATPYFYRVTDAGETTLEGRFHTSAESGSNGLRFGVTGDWRGELRPYAVLANAVERDLEFFIELGDTIYADIPSIDFPGEQAITLEDYRIKHNEVYSERFGRNFLADLRAATSILATIDDHEVTNDFAGGAAPSTDERFAAFGDAPFNAERINQTELYRNGLQVFQEYNPLRDEVYEGTGDDRMEGLPKLYRYNTYGTDAAVIVLDARSFRDQAVPEIDTDNVLNAEARAAYRAAMFEPGRTMLGRQQVEDFKRDLLAAQEAAITWKFVIAPEPVQQMGWFGGSDRLEGYGPERAEIMQFIEDNNILNVVWVAADVHTTFINKLAYQTSADSDNIPTRQFEISTGSLGFYPPTGAALVDGAAEFGLLPAEDYAAYQQMSIAEKDEVLVGLFNRFVMGLEGFDSIGFEGASFNAELTQGSYIAGHTFGWTEFEIEAGTGLLTITTYGVPAYSREALEADAEGVLSRPVEVINQIVATPLTA